MLALFAQHGQTFRIVGGHHRYDAAAYIGFDEVPVTVIMDPEFDDEQERFQLVRMNAIRGKLDPQAFFALYSKLSDKYSDAIMQDAFGFAEEAEFKRLIAQTAKMLPDKELQEKFKEAAQEIKTVDGLSKLLNEMFTKYGDTLPLRLHDLRLRRPAVDVAADRGQDHERPRPDRQPLHRASNRTVDDVMGGVVQPIAKGELTDQVEALIAASARGQAAEGARGRPDQGQPGEGGGAVNIKKPAFRR